MEVKRKNKDYNPLNCPVTFCLNLIGGKWKPLVIYHINRDINRFSLLQKAVPAISKQMLVNQLRELEADHIIKRIVYAEIPPRVIYQLTDTGKSILPIIAVMSDWGKKNMKK
jgi:DNA-binding HxlR family transcriptional regulator